MFATLDANLLYGIGIDPGLPETAVAAGKIATSAPQPPQKPVPTRDEEVDAEFKRVYSQIQMLEQRIASQTVQIDSVETQLGEVGNSIQEFINSVGPQIVAIFGQLQDLREKDLQPLHEAVSEHKRLIPQMALALKEVLVRAELLSLQTQFSIWSNRVVEYFVATMRGREVDPREIHAARQTAQYYAQAVIQFTNSHRIGQQT